MDHHDHHAEKAGEIKEIEISHQETTGAMRFFPWIPTWFLDGSLWS
jgi:hypothetical protein